MLGLSIFCEILERGGVVDKDMPGIFCCICLPVLCKGYNVLFLFTLSCCFITC